MRCNRCILKLLLTGWVISSLGLPGTRHQTWAAQSEPANNKVAQDVIKRLPPGSPESLAIPAVKDQGEKRAIPEFRPYTNPGPIQMRELYDLFGPQFMNLHGPYNGRGSALSSDEAFTRLRPFTWNAAPEEKARVEVKMQQVKQLTDRRKVLMQESFRNRPFPPVLNQSKKSPETLAREAELEEIRKALMAIVAEFEDPAMANAGPPQPSDKLIAMHPDFKRLAGEPLMKFLRLVGSAQDYLIRFQDLETPVPHIIAAASAHQVELTLQQARQLVQTPLRDLAKVAIRVGNDALNEDLASNHLPPFDETFPFPPRYYPDQNSYRIARTFYFLTGQISGGNSWVLNELAGEWTNERVLADYPMFRAKDGTVDTKSVEAVREILNQLIPLMEQQMKGIRDRARGPQEAEKLEGFQPATPREAFEQERLFREAMDARTRPLQANLSGIVNPRLFPGVTPTTRSVRPSAELVSIDPEFARLNAKEIPQFLQYLVRAQTYGQRYPAKRESQLGMDSATLGRFSIKTTPVQYDKLLTTPLEKLFRLE